MALETKTPPQPIYRVGRQPDAWRPPDWSRASADGTFGNRFDDPESYYRVLYASSQEVSCFIETLARYRPDLTLLAELEAIEGDNDFFPLGTVPAEWCANRPWAGRPRKANMPTSVAASGSRTCAADLPPNASAWGSRTWMPACCRVACLVASRNWFRELRMSRDIQAFVIGLDIPTISRTGRCSNHFDFMMRPPSRLITTAPLFEKHYASWD